MDAEKCVCCGAIIPEGQIVCQNCLVAVKTEKGKTMKERLIELMTAFYGVDPGYYGVDAPGLTDYLIAHNVEQVVRCKDCKWSRWHNFFFDEDKRLACVDVEDGEVVFAQVVHENHFCSYGERKDNEIN